MDDKARQKFIDAYARKNNPCCAGCDWWRWHNVVIGECHKAAPVSGDERADMLGISGCSLRVKAGHIFTRRGHSCGDFKDEQ